MALWPFGPSVLWPLAFCFLGLWPFNLLGCVGLPYLCLLVFGFCWSCPFRRSLTSSLSCFSPDLSLLEFLVPHLMLWLFPAGPCHIGLSCRIRLLEGRRSEAGSRGRRPKADGRKSKAGGRRPKWRPTSRPEMIGAVALSQRSAGCNYGNE